MPCRALFPVAFEYNLASALAKGGPDADNSKASGRVLDLLGEAAGFETLFNRSDPSPWTGVELKDGQAVQDAVDLVDRLCYQTMPGLIGSLKERV